MGGGWQVCCVIGCSNTVHQCCNHEGQVSTASLNAVSPRFSGETLEVHLCSFSSFCLSHSPRLLSCLFSLALSFADFASVSLHPFVLDSFASSVSHLFMFISHVVSVLSLFPQSVRVDISGTLRQVVRHGFARLRETRDEKRSVRGQFTSTS